MKSLVYLVIVILNIVFIMVEPGAFLSSFFILKALG